MAIVFTQTYVRGRGQTAVGTAGAASDPTFVWIDLADPSEAELRTLASRFHLHPLAIEDAVSTDSLPKLEPIADDALFVATLSARYDDRTVTFGRIAAFVGPDHIISVVMDDAGDHATLKRSLERVPELMELGVGYVLHGILSSAADSFTVMVDRMDEEVASLEETIPDGALDRAKIVRLLVLRRQLKSVERMLKPMEETGRKLAEGALPCVQPELNIYFRDIVDQIRRAQAVCESIRDGVASVFEYSALLEQQRTGTIAKQLAAWAAILAVPTAIAGIYGMNFSVMPELGWRYGYPAVLAAMLGISLLLYWRFKRSGWL